MPMLLGVPQFPTVIVHITPLTFLVRHILILLVGDLHLAIVGSILYTGMRLGLYTGTKIVL